MLDFCNHQLFRMIGLHNRVLANYNPVNDKCDLVPRIKHGIERSKKTWKTLDPGDADRKFVVTVVDSEMDFAFIIENDDYYPSYYIQNLLPHLDGLDFIGWQNTFYYNIKTRRYSRLEHETHSSLFCTGFRLSALDDFEWPKDDYPFLDIALWSHAKRSGKNWKLLRNDNPCVGIKGHGMGKMGGKGHKMELLRADPDMKWFRNKLNDEEAFKFYQSIV